MEAADWVNLSDEELLEKRISQLGLKLEGTELQPLIQQLYDELTQKGLTFLVVLPLMFAVGLWIEGRIFPFEFSQQLVALAALADLGIGLP